MHTPYAGKWQVARFPVLSPSFPWFGQSEEPALRSELNYVDTWSCFSLFFPHLTQVNFHRRKQTPVTLLLRAFCPRMPTNLRIPQPRTCIYSWSPTSSVSPAPNCFFFLLSPPESEGRPDGAGALEALWIQGLEERLTASCPTWHILPSWWQHKPSLAFICICAFHCCHH